MQPLREISEAVRDTEIVTKLGMHCYTKWDFHYTRITRAAHKWPCRRAVRWCTDRMGSIRSRFISDDFQTVNVKPFFLRYVNPL